MKATCTLLKVNLEHSCSGLTRFISIDVHLTLGYQLKKLNLEKNTIEGALPTSLADLKALEELNFSNNVFTGPLVHIQWGNLSKLEHLHLANNKVCS